MTTTIKQVASDSKSCKGEFQKKEETDVRVECGLDLIK